jgi:hypothetical protein
MIGLELAGPATIHRELVATGCNTFFTIHERRLHRLNPTTSEPAADSPRRGYVTMYSRHHRLRLSCQLAQIRSN